VYKKILLPLDGTKSAEEILPYVESLLQHDPTTKVILLKVVNPQVSLSNLYSPYLYIPYIDETESIEIRTSKAESYLNDIRDRLIKKAFKAESYIAHNSPITGTIKSAEHRDVDLIVMGCHNHTGISRLLHKSISEGVLRQTTRPILLIHASSNGKKDFSIRNCEDKNVNNKDLFLNV
jgi:nucleotide-binding universal stress UspA family protein